MLPSLLFATIVAALAMLVLFARRQLEPSGTVTLRIGEGRTVSVEAGRRLLWALADSGVYLPAACGGRGTCGQCRVRILAGTAPALPAEAAHISTRDAVAGYRLACMQKVRGDMKIELPADILGAERRVCRVASNRSIAAYMKELVLELTDGQPLEFEAGDYVLLESPPYRVAFRDFNIGPEYREQWDDDGVLKLESVAREAAARAYSLANPPQQDDRAVLVVRLALPPASAPAGTPPGVVSSYAFSLEPGDEVAIRGPFGDFHAKDSDREIVLIAGGAGIAPIRSITLDQLARGTGRKISFWYGARNESELCYADELAQLADTHRNFDFRVALSGPGIAPDWQGETGFIHSVVYERFLRDHAAPQDLEYYLCGPPLMSAAVMQMLETLGVARSQVFFDDFGS